LVWYDKKLQSMGQIKIIWEREINIQKSIFTEGLKEPTDNKMLQLISFFPLLILLHYTATELIHTILSKNLRVGSKCLNSPLGGRHSVPGSPSLH